MKYFSVSLLSICASLSVGVALAGYFVSQTIYNGNTATNIAESKGLSERIVQADNADWKLGYEIRKDKNTSIKSLYQEAQLHQRTIAETLYKLGFTANELQIGALRYEHFQYRNNQQKVVDEEHRLSGVIIISTKQVALVNQARASVNDLIAEGIHIQNHAPQYFFSGLNKIKPEMLREATQNARIAAAEFAKLTNVNVGKIKSARQGNFVIRDVGSDYTDNQRLHKTIRVVTHISFYLN